MALVKCRGIGSDSRGSIPRALPPVCLEPLISETQSVYLIQILLPLYGKSGRRLPKRLFEVMARDLAKAHDGVTAYTRSPAVGLWRGRTARLKRDDIVVYEVMTSSLNSKVWAHRRRKWEATFTQDSILIRATRYRQL
jgi:hypothetical protein